MRTKKPRPKATEPDYEPNSREQSAIEKMAARSVADSAPGLKAVGENGVQKISIDHRDQAVGAILLMEAVGAADHAFLEGLIDQLVRLSYREGRVNEEVLNFMFSIVKAIKPRDQIEAMLAAQMAAIHGSAMTFARRLQHVENIPQQDSAERALNKLARTFATQMEALKRYRTGGEQKVTVQHVSVQEGGQAIVGNVTQGPRETTVDRPVDAPRAIEDSKAAPMAILDEPARTKVVARRKAKR